jgi:TRAP-type C4-dicarboxylate transport system permease large subunit
MLPFYVGMFGVLMAVTYLPEISLWLPRLMGLSQ